MASLTVRDRLLRLHLRTEVVAVEACVAVFLSCLLLVDLRPAPAVAWAVVAALVAAATVQALRLRPMRESGPEVNLLGIEVGHSPTEGGAEDAAEDDGSWNASNIFIVAIAAPFIAAWVVIQFLFLYVVPTLVVIIGLVISSQRNTNEGTWRTILAAVVVWGATVAVSAANEHLVVRPIATRLKVPLD